MNNIPKPEFLFNDPLRSYLFLVEAFDANGVELVPKNELTTLVRTVDFTNKDTLKIKMLVDDKNPKTLELMFKQPEKIVTSQIAKNGDVILKLEFTKIYLAGLYHGTKLDHDLNDTDGIFSLVFEYKVEEYKFIDTKTGMFYTFANKI